MTRHSLALAVLALAACTPPPLSSAPEAPPALPDGGQVAADNHATLPTTTTTVTVPTRLPSHHVQPGRSATPTPRAPSPKGRVATLDNAFWQRLANCECRNCGSEGNVNYFQFSPDTAAKVGIDGSESYEEQRAAAIEWLRRIGVERGGTKAGWPTCWWVAKRTG